MPLKGRDGILFISGKLNYEDKEKFLVKIEPFAGGVVVFDSPGGNVYAGVEIGKIIRMRGFKTWVPAGNLCASACALAWLGGTTRLLGATARVGFHAAATTLATGEKKIEDGYSNARSGAYLAQLGLSDDAIFFITGAAPDDMNWLTMERALQIGLAVQPFDPKSDAAVSTSTPIGPPAVTGPAPSFGAQSVPSAAVRSNEPQFTPADASQVAFGSFSTRARDFVIGLNVIMSGPDEGYTKILNGIYADQVVYFGKPTLRADIVQQLNRFIERWPMRSYMVRPETVKVLCDDGQMSCQISGVIDFSAKSVERNQWSRGSATFEYSLAFRPNQKYPVIVNEGGAVLNREMTALQTIQPRYPQIFGAPGR